MRSKRRQRTEGSLIVTSLRTKSVTSNLLGDLMFQQENGVFVDREQEIGNITRLLSTGNVLILGEAGVGKTAIANKIINNLLSQRVKEVTLLQLTATPGSYSGWLSGRLVEKILEEIQSNKKIFSKIIEWLKKYGPDLLEIIKTILETQKGQSSVNKQKENSQLNIENATEQILLKDNRRVVFTLLSQFIKQAKKEVLIVIDDAHELALSDKEFLIDLCANLLPKIHVLILRRPQEKNGALFSSPEVRYFNKQDRIVKISGLSKDAVRQFLEFYEVNFNPSSLEKITKLLSGNPYFLNLLVNFAIAHNRTLQDKEFEKLASLGFSKIEDYLQSQYYTNLVNFDSILKAASILPAHIHAELLSYLLNNANYQRINEQILELEQRGIFLKDEFGGYCFFHPLFQLYIYNHLLSATQRLRFHNSATSYYQKIAKKTPTPLALIATLYHAEKAKDTERQFWALYLFALVYQRVGRLRESKDYAEKALLIAHELKDDKKEFDVLLLLFNTLIPHLKIDNPEEKLIRLKHLLRSEKLNTEENHLDVLLAEANYNEVKGNLEKALESIRECRRIAKQMNNEQEYLNFTQHEATLLTDLGQLENARKELNECLRGFEKIGNSLGVMVTSLSIGNIECLLNPQRAIELLQKSIEIAKKQKEYFTIANALHALGIANFELGKHSEAEHYFKKCITLTRKIGDTLGLMTTYEELAKVMIAMRRFEKASKLIEDARTICDELKHLEGLAYIEFLTGELLEAKEKFNEAEPRFLHASQLFDKLGNKKKAEYALRQYNAMRFSSFIAVKERKLNSFVGKKVRVVLNSNIWEETPSSEKIVYEGILYKEKRLERIAELDRLMGLSKFRWWIEGKAVSGIRPCTGNFLVVPFSVENIEEIK
jgi:tetratricopeptide (TPR) repeat protein